MDTVTPPPVSCWPAQVHADEPVHGFFQRVAAANGQMSCRTFAACLGLNGRNFDFEELLEFCATLPTIDIEALSNATPQRLGHEVVLRGETFSPTHFSFRGVRICAACVNESRHHRNWFDFSFIERCPFHDQPLLDGTADEKLARWYPVVGVTPHTGVNLAKPAPRVAAQDTVGRYILGRIGCLPRWSIPFVDRYTCGEVVQMSDLLGRMYAFGWSMKLKGQFTWNTERRLRTEAGFSILRGGRHAVLEALKEYTNNSPTKASPQEVSFAIGEFYGWLYSSVRELSGTPMIDHFRELMMQHANQSGIFARKGYQTALPVTGAETLGTLSRKLEISLPTAKKVARAVGVSRKHSLSAKDTSKVLEAWSDLLARPVAENIAKSAGLGELSELQQAGLIVPFIRLGGTTAEYDRFRRSSLMALAAGSKASSG
jgi:hypothetical protein